MREKQRVKLLIEGGWLLDWLERMEKLLNEARERFSEGVRVEKALNYSGEEVASYIEDDAPEGFKVIILSRAFSPNQRPILWLRRHLQEMGAIFTLDPSGRITITLKDKERREEAIRAVGWTLWALRHSRKEVKRQPEADKPTSSSRPIGDDEEHIVQQLEKLNWRAYFEVCCLLDQGKGFTLECFMEVTGLNREEALRKLRLLERDKQIYAVGPGRWRVSSSLKGFRPHCHGCGEALKAPRLRLDPDTLRYYCPECWREVRGGGG